MPKKTIEQAVAKTTRVKNTVEDAVDTARLVVDKAPEVVETFKRKRSLIERLGVKNPVVSAAIAAVVTAAGFVTGVLPL